MSTGSHPVPHRFHRPRRWVLWMVVGLVVAPVAAAGMAVAVDRVFFSGQGQYAWPPEPCVVQEVDARCGTFMVPEDRAKPNGRTIGLNVVVLPALSKPARTDAITYLAGGPGDAATEQAVAQGWQSSAVNMNRDILLVDQRGTGRSNPHGGDVTQYAIWCNEPWTGLDAKGPWGTDFDSYTTAEIAAFRKECRSIPKRAEPRSLWTLPASSPVPVLAFVGGADPQDPVTNLSDLKQHFLDSRTVVFPHIGHQFGIGGCADQIMADFVERGTTKGVDTTRCDGAVVVPPFEGTD